MIISGILIVLLVGTMGATGQLPSIDRPARRPMLACAPKTLSRTDTLTLRFGKSHPGELAIRAPDGVWYFVVYERDKSMTPGLQPLMETPAFRRTNVLQLAVATFKATPWAAGRETNEIVFRDRGTYEVVLTDTLETHGDRAVFRCKVVLRGPVPPS